MLSFLDTHDPDHCLSDLGLIGFWECDFKAGRIKVSPELALFYGVMSFDEQGECDTSQFVANILPDDQNWADRWRPLGVDSTGIGTIQYRVQDKAGDTRWVMCRGRYKVDAQGGLLAGHGMVFDITTAKLEGKAILSPEDVGRHPLDHIADLLLEAYSVAERVHDDGILAALSTALIKVAQLLSKQQSREAWQPHEAWQPSRH